MGMPFHVPFCMFVCEIIMHVHVLIEFCLII